MEALDRIAGIPPPTTWKTVSASIFYYSTLPVVKISTWTLNTVLVLSSPLIHLVSYIAHVLLIPLSLFGKLEVCIKIEINQGRDLFSNWFADILYILWRCSYSWSSGWRLCLFHLQLLDVSTWPNKYNYPTKNTSHYPRITIQTATGKHQAASGHSPQR